MKCWYLSPFSTFLKHFIYEMLGILLFYIVGVHKINIIFMKRKPSELSKEDKIRTLDLLYTAAASIRGRTAMKLFLRDLLTESERIMTGGRIWIARLLI